MLIKSNWCLIPGMGVRMVQTQDLAITTTTPITINLSLIHEFSRRRNGHDRKQCVVEAKGHKCFLF